MATPQAGGGSISFATGSHVSGSTTSGKQDRVKVAIEPDKSQNNVPPLLMDFEHSLALTMILREVCGRWDIPNPERYSFKYSDSKSKGSSSKLQGKFGYLTEENRQDLKNGDILCIAVAPKHQAKDTFTKISANDPQKRSEGIQELTKLSRDYAFACEFVQLNGVGMLMMIVEKAQLSSVADKQEQAHVLGAFQELMEHSIVSWDTVGENFVKKVVNFLDRSRQTDSFHPQFVSRSLAILESILLSGTAFHEIITREISPSTIIQQFITKQDVTKPESLDVIHYALALINAMISTADNRQKALKSVADAQLSQAINTSILQVRGEVDRDIAHQLSIYQSYILNQVEGRMRMPFKEGELQFEEALRLLPSRAFPDDYPSLRSTGQVSEQHWKQLGFTHANPRAEFSTTPPGVLALDCMVFLAKQRHEIFTRLLFAHTDNPCPFALTSVALTRVLCQIFRIGEQPSEIGYITEFIPALIPAEEPFKEVFCITIQLLFKTWREMRASLLDLEKVMAVVTKQITTVLQSEKSTSLTSFDLLRTKLYELSYKKITESEEKSHLLDEAVLKSKPVEELRESILPEIQELVKQERLHHLIQGASFPKLGRRGRDQYFYCKLAPNLKVIHFGDSNGQSSPPLEALDKKIQVSEMKLEVGPNCPAAERVKKQTNFVFSLCYIGSNGEDHLDFYAPTETVFHVWIDGLSVLLGKKMPSKAAEEDLETLLNMDLKLRLLDLENITIPSQPPTIPPEPSNYDFYYNYND